MRTKFFPIHVDNTGGVVSFDLIDDIISSLRGCTAIVSDRSDQGLPKKLTVHIYNFPWSKQSDDVMRSRMVTHLTHVTEAFLVQTDAIRSHIYYVMFQSPWESIQYDSTTGATTCATDIAKIVALTDQVSDTIITKLRRVYPDERIWNE